MNKLTLKKSKKSNGWYTLIGIYMDAKKIGDIELSDEGYTIEVSSITIDKQHRSKGYGTQALIGLKKYLAGKAVSAYCVSLESFYTFIKAWGQPERFGNTYKDFEDYKQVDKYLPNKASEGANGQIISGTDSAVWIEYQF